jgi:ssDNA-binding Zn-finger/Zn-ribbon topoisomerase 1
MLTQRPQYCPLCGGGWGRYLGKQMVLGAVGCDNYDTCQMAFLDDGNRYFLRRYFDGGEVWWSSEGPSEVRWIDSTFRKLTFDPPFNITRDRLRLLIVFS